MADMLKLKGLKQLDRKLASMDKKLAFKALRKALMAASKPMFLAARANAMATGVKGRDAGSTAAAMGRFVKKITPKRTALFIGPKSKSKKALALWNAANGEKATRLGHFHLLEFGSIHGPSQPYMRPAFEATKWVVAKTFGTELNKAIILLAKQRA